MKIQSFKRIFKSDYDQEDQSLVEKLSYSINTGIEVINNALNRNISLADNILCSIRDVDVQVDANGYPISLTTYSLDFKGSIQGVIVIRADNLTNSAIYPTSSPFINFTQNTNGVKIDHVTGLIPNNIYRLRIVTFG